MTMAQSIARRAGEVQNGNVRVLLDRTLRVVATVCGNFGRSRSTVAKLPPAQSAETCVQNGETIALARYNGERWELLIAGPELESLLSALASLGAHCTKSEQHGTPNARFGASPDDHVAAQNVLPQSTYIQSRHPDLCELLTHREVDVLQLLVLRQTNKEIAHELGISADTVKQHMSNLFRKLQVKNRREVIVKAQALGFQVRQ
jgi:DNA-binding CsgD family transcriptional regulator